jgi:hypothetical protein
MKNSLPSVLLGSTLALLACATAHAEEVRFTGTALAIGIGAASNQLDYGGLLAGKTSKHTSTVGKLDLSHGFNLAPRWVATVGIAYDLNKTDLGTVSYVDSGRTYDVQGKLKNHLSLYVAPGYRFASNWLGYAKLGWHSAEVEFNDSQVGAGKTKHGGVSFGLGVSTALSQHLEARFEVQRINLNRQSANLSSGKPEATQALVYLGYRF